MEDGQGVAVATELPVDLGDKSPAHFWIGKTQYLHVREDADGRWIYRTTT